MAAASSLAWRMLNASMIWEKPRNSAKNPTQHKMTTTSTSLLLVLGVVVPIAAATGIGC
jgi:hypothetical protein